MQPHHLDDYCERLGSPELWAEPLNAVTNLAFLIAAWRIFALLRALTWRETKDIYALTLVLCCIGVGSGAWHLYPTSTTLMMDVLPITLFIYGYMAAFLRRVWSLARWKIALILAAMLGSNAVTTAIFPPDTLFGTILYMPTYAVLVIITLIGYTTRAVWATPLTYTVLLWTCSLTMRTIDKPLCELLPNGTHFMWHTLNAWVLYRLLCLLRSEAQR
jgi:Ceramidase